MRTVRPSIVVGAAGLALGILGVAQAQAQGIQVIFSNLPGDPSNVVPSLTTGWKPGVTTQFDRPFLSPDGTKWVIGGFVNDATTADRVIVAGTGTTRTGATLAQREGPASFDAGRNYTFFDTELSINDSGVIAFAADLDGSTLNDEVLCTVNSDGTNLSLILREDQAEPTGSFPGNFVGATIDSPNITNDGRVGFKTLLDGPGTATVVTPLTANNNDFLFVITPGSGITTLAQEGVTPVEPTGPNWDLFDAGDFYLSGDGSKYVAQGNDEGAAATDQIGVYFSSGASDVVIREGDLILPPGAVNTSGASELFMSRNGLHWISCGSNSGADTNDWVVRDGVVVAGTDLDITPNNANDPAELYDDAPFAATFFSIAVSNTGDYIVGGTTNNVNADSNAVLVLNGERVVVREGDPVDVNGDGIANDNVRVSVFNNHDMVLTGDRKLYFMADLRDDAGVALTAQAFLVIDLNVVPVACDSIDFNNDTLTPDSGDLDDFLAVLAGGPSACSTAPAPGCNDLDFNNDGLFPDSLDLDAFISRLAGGPCLQ